MSPIVLAGVTVAALSAGAFPAFAFDPTATEGAVTSVRGCEVRYRVYPAPGYRSGPVVVIAHGLLRSGEFMAGWAEAIAREGTPSVTVDLCASAEVDGRIADNGIDLVALRRALRIDEVVYAGVSAGGLAALVAASRDAEATRGLLLLDPVNAGGQARGAAGKVRAPVAALVSRPQVCNAWRNIDPALSTLREATIVRIDAASHCDFEWPTNAFCKVACIATGSDERSRRAQARIRDVGLGFVRAIRDGDADALYRWKGELGSMLR